jgi:DNA-binding XRE family transcriptional regulator
MGNDLLDLLGIDPDDQRYRDALEDAKEAERLIDALVALRNKLGITQAQIAEQMETTQSAVSKFERAGGDPHLSTVQRYARAVGARFRGVVDSPPCFTADWTVPMGGAGLYSIHPVMHDDPPEPINVPRVATSRLVPVAS